MGSIKYEYDRNTVSLETQNGQVKTALVTFLVGEDTFLLNSTKGIGILTLIEIKSRPLLRKYITNSNSNSNKKIFFNNILLFIRNYFKSAL